MITDIILTDLNIQKTTKNRNLINSLINDKTAYMWFKIPTLMEKLKPFKGYMSLSNSKSKFKIGMEHNASDEYQVAFIKIVRNWADKYNINIEYCFEKNLFYII